MTSINSVVIVGNLCREPELKYTTSGTPVLSFSVAVNKSVKKNEQWEDEVSFFDAAMFGSRAEGISKYMAKGTQVVISGSLHQDRWTDKAGQTQSRVKINADNVQLIGGKKE